MALLAESLVEEWLNRQGFFTIRGVKQGQGEMDLLAIRPDSGGVIGWHVEVTVSFRPIGYIARELAGGGRRGSFVRKRTPDEIQAYARTWVEAKFAGPDKADLRDRLWPGARWSRHLVHGAVRYPEELAVFAAAGVICHPFHQCLSDLGRREAGGFSGSAGGDLAEIVSYFKTHSAESGTAASDKES